MTIGAFAAARPTARPMQTGLAEMRYRLTAMFIARGTPQDDLRNRRRSCKNPVFRFCLPPDTRDSPPHPILLPKLKQSSTKHASIAFIILAHQRPEAVRRLAEFVAPEAEAAAVHHDGRVPQAEFRSLQAAVGGDHRVLLLQRRRCA